mmetsp:Transcript_57746/g.67404  ORF Transcript_57746/g.67404 Transcript_57746/m.67404 type:complete len:202 (+) Transcript_57746:616-1221(+)
MRVDEHDLVFFVCFDLGHVLANFCHPFFGWTVPVYELPPFGARGIYLFYSWKHKTNGCLFTVLKKKMCVHVRIRASFCEYRRSNNSHTHPLSPVFPTVRSLHPICKSCTLCCFWINVYRKAPVLVPSLVMDHRCPWVVTCLWTLTLTLTLTCVSLRLVDTQWLPSPQFSSREPPPVMVTVTRVFAFGGIKTPRTSFFWTAG